MRFGDKEAWSGEGGEYMSKHTRNRRTKRAWYYINGRGDVNGRVPSSFSPPSVSSPPISFQPRMRAGQVHLWDNGRNSVLGPSLKQRKPSSIPFVISRFDGDREESFSEAWRGLPS